VIFQSLSERVPWLILRLMTPGHKAPPISGQRQGVTSRAKRQKLCCSLNSSGFASIRGLPVIVTIAGNHSILAKNLCPRAQSIGPHRDRLLPNSNVPVTLRPPGEICFCVSLFTPVKSVFIRSSVVKKKFEVRHSWLTPLRLPFRSALFAPLRFILGLRVWVALPVLCELCALCG